MAKAGSEDEWVAFTFKLPASSLEKYKEAAKTLQKTMAGQMKVGLSAWLRMAADEKLASTVPAPEPIEKKKGSGR